jgi:hypothetical protein
MFSGGYLSAFYPIPEPTHVMLLGEMVGGYLRWYLLPVNWLLPIWFYQDIDLPKNWLVICMGGEDDES